MLKKFGKIICLMLIITIIVSIGVGSISASESSSSDEIDTIIIDEQTNNNDYCFTNNVAPSTYTTWRGDYTHAGVLDTNGPKTNKLRGTITYSQIPSYNEKGELSSITPSLVDGAPVIDENRIYFTIWDGGMPSGKLPDDFVTGLYCHDIATGNEVWNSSKLISRAPLTIHDNKIYGGTIDGKLVCLNSKTGDRIWSTESISTYSSVGLTATPTVLNNTVYVITSSSNSKKTNDTLYAFDAESGGMKYNISANGVDGVSGGVNMYASVSADPDGNVLFVPGKNGVFAVRETDGSVLWTTDLNAKGGESDGETKIYVGTPVYKDERLYVLTTDNLSILDAKTGVVINQTNYKVSALAPVVTDDLILATSAGLVAFDMNGTLKWETTDKSETGCATPIVADNVAYYGTTSGKIFAINVTDGSELWNYTLPKLTSGWQSLIEATPAVHNNELYVGAEDGVFYVFGEGENTFEVRYPTSYTPPFEIIGSTFVDVKLNATFSTNTSTDYSWDFGDGAKTSTPVKIVKHSWKEAGTYVVTASAHGSVAKFTVNVTTPPKPLDEGASTSVEEENIIIESPTTPVDGVKTSPDSGDIVLEFSNDVLNTTVGEATIILRVSEYQAVTNVDAKVTLDSERYTAPQDTKKTIFLMNVTDVTNITQTEQDDGSHRMETMAKLVVKLNVTKDTAKNISFWRYVDGDKNPRPLTSTIGAIDETGVAEDEIIAVEYTVYIPGFSTIIASVDDGNAIIVNPTEDVDPDDPTPPGPSPGPGPSINYVDVDPGSGTFEYTTNHPEWPAVTFTIDRMSAFGVLIASGNSVVTAERWGGLYIDSINGKIPSSDTEGWMYQVNGNSPGSMANNYPVSVGDKVIWYFSKDMSDPVEKSPQIYAFTVTGTGTFGGDSANGKPKNGVELKAEAATEAEVKITLPDTITITTSGIGQNIRLEESVADGKTISIQDNCVQIKSAGLLITVETTGMASENGVVTAKVTNVTAEIVPKTVAIPVIGLTL